MLENTEGQSKMDNSEKLATRKKHVTKYVLDTTIRKQTQIT